LLGQFDLESGGSIFSEHLAKILAAALLPLVEEVHGSHLGPDTGYGNRFLWPFWALDAFDRFITLHFRFIVHFSGPALRHRTV